MSFEVRIQTSAPLLPATARLSVIAGATWHCHLQNEHSAQVNGCACYGGRIGCSENVFAAAAPLAAVGLTPLRQVHAIIVEIDCPVEILILALILVRMHVMGQGPVWCGIREGTHQNFTKKLLPVTRSPCISRTSASTRIKISNRRESCALAWGL